MAPNFDRMKDGYNRYQVDSAIEELNMRIDSLERVNEAYRLRCTQLEEQIRHLQSIYDPAFQNLRQKEDAASQMVAIAMKQTPSLPPQSRMRMSSSAKHCWMPESCWPTSRIWRRKRRMRRERCSGRHSGSPTCSMNSRRWHFQRWNCRINKGVEEDMSVDRADREQMAGGNLWWRPTGITSELTS